MAVADRRQKLWDLLVIGFVVFYMVFPSFGLLEYAFAEVWYAYRLNPTKLGLR